MFVSCRSSAHLLQGVPVRHTYLGAESNCPSTPLRLAHDPEASATSSTTTAALTHTIALSQQQTINHTHAPVCHANGTMAAAAAPISACALAAVVADMPDCNHSAVDENGAPLVTAVSYELSGVGHVSVPDVRAVKFSKIVFLGHWFRSVKSTSTATTRNITIAVSHCDALALCVWYGLAIPSPGHRNTSAIALQLSNTQTVLMDCGEATQHQIMQSASVRAGNISAILITHMHGDHCFGLFGLLCTVASNGRTDPLLLVGPKGLQHMVTTVLSCSGGFSGLQLQFLELEPERTYTDLGIIAGGLQLSAYPLAHRVASFGYVLREGSKPGALDVARAKALGANGKQLGALKEGKDVTLDDGRVVRSADCVGPPLRGRSLALLQDTYDSTSARAACQDVDVLIHECTYSAAMRQKAIDFGHSTSAMAGEYAAQVNAKMLLLTHFSNRYETRPQTAKRLAAEKLKLDAAAAAGAAATSAQSSSATAASLNATVAANSVAAVTSQLQSSSLSSVALASASSSAAAAAPAVVDFAAKEVDTVQSMDELVAEALAAYTAAHSEHRAPTFGVHAAEDWLAVDSKQEGFTVAEKKDKASKTELQEQ